MQKILHDCIQMLQEYNKQQHGESITRLVEHKLVDLQKQVGLPSDYIPKRQANESWGDYHERIKGKTTS